MCLESIRDSSLVTYNTWRVNNNNNFTKFQSSSPQTSPTPESVPATTYIASLCSDERREIMYDAYRRREAE